MQSRQATIRRQDCDLRGVVLAWHGAGVTVPSSGGASGGGACTPDATECPTVSVVAAEGTGDVTFDVVLAQDGPTTTAAPEPATRGVVHACGDIPYGMSALHDHHLTNCWYSHDAVTGTSRWFIAGADPKGQGYLGIVSTDRGYTSVVVPGGHGSTTIVSVDYAKVCLRSADSTREQYDATTGAFTTC